MRIISGYLKGRRLNVPNNLPIRPTTDLAKESLFNILRNEITFEDVTTLDLFAGTGSISFEFISRGVKQATTVDINPKCIDFIKKTSQQLNINNLFALKNDVFVFFGRSQLSFDLVFCDPPYDLKQIDKIPDLVLKSFVKPNGLFILEHSKEHSFKEHPCFKEQRNYGKVNFTFFSNTTKE
ncbi:MAG: 16S rRNA (guanine(966)-N(2))-methyltransferase RsmD [Bacteroidales bacterium]|jgi:16S rRNA (guanine(966)-N(2))-methyltransferase RsmD|nr:16S rRNA (guanine(966)-N(2))-methyltransferase RsmD [Bacteroidales bacterium]